MPDRMTDKVTIITGAGTGIGRACMELFAAEGAKVVGCGRRENMLQESLDIVSENRGEGHIVAADLSNLEDAQNVISKTISLYGRIDCLVHAASVGWSWSHTSEDSMNDIANTPPEKWHEVIGINLNACYYMCHGVLQHMLEAGQGSIVNVASISGMVGMQSAHTYCSAKGGVINLTRAMANSYGKLGVRANCVCPGYTDTPMIADVMNIFDDEVLADNLTPMSRAGTPLEMAYGCLYLASDEASYCNGVILPIDGGTVARQ
jgi:NAD(P)-dependent dehydrogenase (short-subunit alcohol dehydrogenase family)